MVLKMLRTRPYSFSHFKGGRLRIWIFQNKGKHIQLVSDKRITVNGQLKIVFKNLGILLVGKPFQENLKVFTQHPSLTVNNSFHWSLSLFKPTNSHMSTFDCMAQIYILRSNIVDYLIF